MSKLSEEMKAYESMRNTLEADHLGKWVVFQDKKMVALHDTFEEAADDAVTKFGRGPYLIRQVGEVPIALSASVLYNPVTIHD